MNIEDIPRRERRHYRIYKDGKITYSDVPVKPSNKEKLPKKDTSTSFSSNLSNDQDIDISDSLLNIDDEKRIDKNKVRRVLKNISELVNPSIDNISEAIYEQVKNDSFYDFKKEEIQETIKNSKHYRATRKQDTKEEVLETEGIEPLVEDVFVQLKKDKIKSKEKKDKKVKAKKVEKKESKKVDKKVSKKESEIKDLFDEESSDDLDMDLEDDDLGLKF